MRARRCAEGLQGLYVSTNEELRELVALLKGSPVLAVDTEFLREHTYYAKLCLVQLCNGDVEAIVDPIAIPDLAPLAEVLGDPGTVKVFHAGGQDIEALLRATGVMPLPLFDTQVGASILGNHHQIGLGNLVKEMCGVELPKKDSLTDWQRRPLSTTQVEYALDDVRYLPGIYQTMIAELERLGRTSWADADFARLADPANYTVDLNEVWRRVKRVSSLSRKQLAAAREIAAWREETAQRRDVPRRRVLADEVVVELARRIPKSPADALAVRTVSQRMSLEDVRALIKRIDAAVKAGPSTWPKIDRVRHVSVDTEASVDLLTALAHRRARENNVSATLLAPHDDIARLAHGQYEGNPILEGWRKPLIGDEMVALLEGRIALSIDHHNLKVTKLDQGNDAGE